MVLIWGALAWHQTFIDSFHPTIQSYLSGNDPENELGKMIKIDYVRFPGRVDREGEKQEEGDHRREGEFTTPGISMAVVF